MRKDVSQGRSKIRKSEKRSDAAEGVMSIEANELLRLLLVALTLAGVAITWIFDWRMSKRVKRRSLFSLMTIVDMAKTKEFYGMLFGGALTLISGFTLITLFGRGWQ